jgi:hypothetical protein
VFDMKLQVIGADRFRSMKNPKGTITNASWAFMRKQGAIYLKHAIEEAPVGRDWSGEVGGFNRQGHPGLLQRSHILRVRNPFRAEVVNTAFYARYVAEGTRPHRMPPPSSGLPWPVRRAIGLHGTRANPWFDRAFAMGEAEIQDNLDTMGDEIMQEFFR